MKISVAMATYNGEKYIEQQLQSIFNQTRPVDEVVICDDVSQDQTVAIVNRFIKAHNLNNWSCFENEKNLGFRENFRKAVDLVSGELIFFADQDDIWVKNRVEIMSTMMEEQSEIGVLSTDYSTFRNPDEIHDTVDVDTNISPHLIRFNKRNIYLRSLGCAMCFRRDFYEQVRNFWKENRAHDAFLWSASLLLLRGYHTKYFSINHRVHNEQYSGHKDHSKEGRIGLLERAQQNQIDMLIMSQQLGVSLSMQKMLQKSLYTTTLRLELLQDRKIINAIHLLKYIGRYRSKRSYLVELKMVLKG